MADSLSNTAYNITAKSLQLHLQLSQIPIHNNTETMLSITFDHFSYQCKNFTIALSLKYQLQHYYFHQTNTTAISQYIYSILVYLQTMADILDDIEFNINSRRCIRLTAAEYKMMYYVRYGNASPLDSLEDMEDWADRGNYEEGTTPSTCNCEILHPSLTIMKMK